MQTRAAAFAAACMVRSTWLNPDPFLITFNIMTSYLHKETRPRTMRNASRLISESLNGLADAK